jgi:hypothetical protein
MLAMAEHPRRAAEPGAHPVYCARCKNPRPLAMVAPGTLWLRHKHHERTITGLTPQQRIWAKCECGHQQEIVLPQN